MILDGRPQRARAGAAAARARRARRARSTTGRSGCPAASSSASRSPWPSPTSPTVLFADEPTGELDTTTSHEIFALLRRVNERARDDDRDRDPRPARVRAGPADGRDPRRPDLDGDAPPRAADRRRRARRSMSEEFAVLDRAGRLQLPKAHRRGARAAGPGPAPPGGRPRRDLAGRASAADRPPRADGDSRRPATVPTAEPEPPTRSATRSTWPTTAASTARPIAARDRRRPRLPVGRHGHPRPPRRQPRGRSGPS